MSEHEQLSARRSYNAVTDFIDVNVARGNGGKVAFKEKDRAISYGELQSASCRFGRGLYKLGLRPESRIVLLHLDTIEFPVAFWGAIRAGVIPIPLNTLLTPEQYGYFLEDSRVEAIVVSPALVKSVAPILNKLTRLRVAIVPAPYPGQLGALETHSFAEVLAQGTPEVFAADTVSDEVAFWLYSS